MGHAGRDRGGGGGERGERVGDELLMTDVGEEAGFDLRSGASGARENRCAQFVNAVAGERGCFDCG